MVVESYEQDRLFQDAVHDLVQALPGIYCGSRDAAVRYIYHGTTLGNFIELKPEQHPMTPPEFFKLLSAVPDVLEVVLHPKSKLEQKIWPLLSRTYFLGTLTSAPPTWN